MGAIEKIAKDFSADPEQILPQAGALESAKSYREKKVKPLWNKIVTVLRSLYRSYLELKARYNNLLQRYTANVSEPTTWLTASPN